MSIRLAVVVALSLILAGVAVRVANPGPVWLACVVFVVAFTALALAGFALVAGAGRKP